MTEEFITGDYGHVLAFVHVNLPVFMFNQYFDDFVRNGITPEIGLDCNVLDAWPLEAYQPYAHKLAAARLNPSMHAPFIGLDPGSDDPAQRDKTRMYLAKTLDVIDIFKPANVVWHTGIWRDKPVSPTFMDNFTPTAAWFAAELQLRGARLVLENTYETDPGLHLALLDRLKPCNVGFCLDTGHSNAFGKQPLETWLESGLLPYLAEIHLHDNHGESDAHLAPGSGSVNFAPLLKYLRTMPRQNWPLITLEPHEKPDLLLALKFVKNKLFNGCIQTKRK